MQNRKFEGNIIDAFAKEIFFGEIIIEKEIIANIIRKGPEQPEALYISPGFIDSHIHIESSMLIPSEFARLAVLHGTVGTISDPHEIANVCGIEGVQYMIENGKKVPFKFHFGAPSCVPATIFETAGACLDDIAVKELLHSEDIFYLSEMMNFPGVLNGDVQVMKKIAHARAAGKPVDGHAPALTGDAAIKYINAGISTDHECFTEEEALFKLQHGMKILIREGSAAKNFDALISLLHNHEDEIMFCSDDKHPDSLLQGHINELCRRAVAHGVDLFKVMKAACINPVLHYKMRNGLLRIGDAADFVVLKNPKNFKVLETVINGMTVSKDGESFIESVEEKPINNFCANSLNIEQISVSAHAKEVIKVIEALDGQLITNAISAKPLIVDNTIVSDVANDVLKIVVHNRYQKAAPAVAFIKGFGIKRGAIASTVAHDSHNIVAVGADDGSILTAIELLEKAQGGISAVGAGDKLVLPLPVAGLMSNSDGFEVAATYAAIDKFAKDNCGSTLSAPFMTLSFMALLVIPSLKLSDKGLFDGEKFSFTAL